MTVPLPSLDEQRRILEKLDRVAALVDERRNAIEAAERETHALLLKAFQRAIDGATLRPMAEVAPLVRRPVEIDLDASYPELGVRSFGRGTFHKPDLLGADLSWQKLFLVQQGDLVFSNIKAWEGAFAVAGPDDRGRVGSHRYLTCVPTQGLATADFIWFYLQTSEGLGKVQSASPGSADRNRTLGQGALEAITVPTPPYLIARTRDPPRLSQRHRAVPRGTRRQDAGEPRPAPRGADRRPEGGYAERRQLPAAHDPPPDGAPDRSRNPRRQPRSERDEVRDGQGRVSHLG
jgi:type I restriction enzyme S subunit